MAKVGRPPKLNEIDIEKLMEAFDNYINETDMPIIAEFAYKNNLGKQYFHERQEFSNLIKKCTTKKEAYLERESIKGNINTTQAIFSLKQLGWKDKQEIDQTIANKDDKPFKVVLEGELKDWSK